jgi:plasmid stabilization system protein ParE
MKLTWTPRAQDDLQGIADYIARDDAVAARRWIENIRRRARAAAARPGTGRMVPEYERVDLREVLLRAYRIIYRVHPGRVLVLRVIEGHQRAPPLELLLVPEP